MPSSYTALNRFVKQAAGEDLNTWGTNLNTQALDLIDFTAAGVTQFTLSGNITLTSANGAADQARAAALKITSGSGGNITIPALSHVYQVLNQTSGNVSISTGSGTSATVEAANSVTVVSDGTNVYRFTDAADVATCLAAAKAYTDAAAFASSSGVLPGQPGNAGKYLATNGTTASWAAVLTVPTLATPRTIGMTGDVVWTSPSFDGSANVTAAGTIQPGAVTGSKVAAATIAGSNIAAATIAGSNIAAATIAGSNIAAATITGSNLTSAIALPGAPTTTTATLGDNSTKVATTGFVQANKGGFSYTGVSALTVGRGLTVADAGYVLILSQSVSNIALNIPTNASQAFNVGAIIRIYCTSTQLITLTASGGVTIDWFTGSAVTTGTRTFAKGGWADLVYTVSDTWYLSGQGIS